MSAEEVWPLNLTDDQIRADLMARKTTATRAYYRSIFATLWCFLLGALELFFALTANTDFERVLAYGFVVLLLAYTWAGARQWDKNEVMAHAAGVAVADWDHLCQRGDAHQVRAKVTEAAVGLQAALLLEQHQFEEYMKAKAAAKAKKRKRGAGDGQG